MESPNPQLELSNLVKDLVHEIKGLRKDMRKVKQLIDDPTGEKAAARSKNNGFNKPQKVTEELRAFLSLQPDEMISRAQVGNLMNKYFEAHGLKNGQKINMDDKLKALLLVPDDIQLSFLNIQHYMNKHYIKEPKPEVPKKEKPAPAAPKSPKPTATATPATPAAPIVPAADKPKVARPTLKKPAAPAAAKP